MSVSIIHLLSADTPAPKLRVLDALLSKLNDAHRHTLVQVGPGPPVRLPGETRIRRIRAAFNIPWLAAGRLREIAEKADVQLAHLWSNASLSWCPPLIEHGCRLLIEPESPRDARQIARWHASSPLSTPPGFACPTALTRRRLIEHGVPEKNCALIREFVDFAAINNCRAAQIRSALDLTETQRVVLLLPPVDSHGGHVTSMWATLLVHVIRDDVRVVIPDRSPEASRLRKLARNIGRASAMRFPGDRFDLPQLLAACDVALYLPPADASVSALVWAMASGRPILASATYAVAEMLANQHNAWLCRPDDPKVAARKLLRIIESPGESRDLIDRARAQAYEVFGRQRMIAQYARAYENLIADRPVGDGIADSATQD
ncbi:MAG: glycosyltransferase [Planctomycetes bacterium]|nr:glycosyltransferase [Planctomycetota bacterium]